MFFILFCLIFFGHVTCQVSLYNPYFWTAIINPNSRYSGSTYSIVANSTKKTFSQDFQTVLYEKDNYGHSERILINFGDACEVPSIEEVLGYNQNATFSQFLSTQLIAALIQRGGRCDSWLNKVINLQSFAYINASFQLRSVIIYDNTTSFDNNSNGSNSSVQLYPENQDDPNDPMMNPHSPLPPERNITLMKDNDISHQIKNINQVDISVYFVPNVYGVYLINTLNDVYSTSDSSGNHYLQIAPYFQNKIFSNNDLNNGINNNGQSNGWRDDDGGLFGFGSKGNIAYLVAAAAAVILGVVLFKMCRHPRSRQNNNDPENQLDMQSMSRNNNNNEPSNITLEKLNMMCPIQTAGDSLLDIKYSTCAICLDDFKPTSHIRILPCLHSYCVDCIDLWLTKKSRFCPVCKRDIDKEALNKEDNDDDGDIGNSTMLPSNEMNNNNNTSVHLTSSLPSTSTTTAPSSGIRLNSRTSPSLQPEASFIDLNNPSLTAITAVSNSNNNHDREEIDLTTIAMPVPMSSSPRVPLPSQMESNIESINEHPTPPHDKQQQQQQQ